MNDSWDYNKICKNNINKARLQDLMTTCKRKKHTHLKTCNKKKTTHMSIYCKQKKSQWFAGKGDKIKQSRKMWHNVECQRLKAKS
jgi:hypothetical protein